MFPRSVLLVAFLGSFSVACGGAPRAGTADLVAIRQPTPDPTLAAVVRDLPRALAGVIPTPIPTPLPTVAPKVVKPVIATPTATQAKVSKPAGSTPTPTARTR